MTTTFFARESAARYLVTPPDGAGSSGPISLLGDSHQRMASAGLRAFMQIAQAWGLTVDQQLALLGQPPRSTFFAWRKQPEKAALSRDTLERLSNLLGIYKSLQMLLPQPEAADAWVRKPNAAQLFGGRSALDRMLAGNVADLNLVRRYLDGVRGGGWS